jgi:hypothetical protein
VLIPFADEDDSFDYRLEDDPRLLQRIAVAQETLVTGRATRL